MFVCAPVGLPNTAGSNTACSVVVTSIQLVVVSCNAKGHKNVFCTSQGLFKIHMFMYARRGKSAL